MNRLTSRNEHGDLLLMGEEAYAGDSYEAVSALEEYEDLEEQGRLIKLPCKVGDTVYVINCYCGECENSDEFAAVIDVGVSCPIGYTEKCAMRIDEESFLLEHYDDFGKTVFLTREEAEQALSRKLKGE